ncbi:hypothetical protein DLAC_11682 [Tieghemostelium lacteum]|uniref:Uncharacterized protein n=1 Tax=Tieghemostelium lacteum TaxID=361077 RepID=A0A151ZD77_TIELA|nr:hypothetical protein DLAC_11682 [Tieghemostelium lacteum]|eukprot:KYQ91875.1 hypothetical protein DLAC_11682 [Tieghemostelium lacteum]
MEPEVPNQFFFTNYVQKKLDHFINTSVQLLVLIVVVSNVIEDMLIVIGFKSKQIKQIKLGENDIVGINMGICSQLRL